MRLLLDTHILLWVAGPSNLLSQSARKHLDDTENEIFFSVISIWEVVIKRGRDRDDFQVDPLRFRQGLLANGYRELPISAGHVLAVGGLPPIHNDPFDRLLIAQAKSERMSLITADKMLARYGEPVTLV